MRTSDQPVSNAARPIQIAARLLVITASVYVLVGAVASWGATSDVLGAVVGTFLSSLLPALIIARGLIRRRRWARSAGLVLATLWLVGGVFATVFVVALVSQPHLQRLGYTPRPSLLFLVLTLVATVALPANILIQLASRRVRDHLQSVAGAA